MGSSALDELIEPQVYAHLVTATARLVLEDCRLARSELVDGPRGPQWRIGVFTVMALLRASMHALDKVDAVTEPMKSANASV